MKKQLLSLSIFVLNFLTSCNHDSSLSMGNHEATDQVQMIKISMPSDPSTLDPREARGLQSATLSRLLFEGLLRQEMDGELKPGLAEKVDVSDDRKTYTFHLRDALWSNGEPITAYDFEYSWKSLLEPQAVAPNAYQIFMIRGAKSVKEGDLAIEEVGIKAKDAKTLVVELENPTPYFLEIAAFFPLFPIYSKGDHKKENPPTVFSGPFRLEKWMRGNEMVFVKNPSYWDADAVHLDKISFQIVHNDTALKLFEAGNIDWVGSPLGTIPPDAQSYLKAHSKLEFAPAAATYFFRVNTTSPPFDQPAIRKAFSYALNREEIVHHVTQGNQKSAMGLVPPTIKPGIKSYFADHNLSKAKSLFDQALLEKRIKKEDFPVVKIVYGQDERNHKMAQAIQAQWKKVFGTEIQLQSYEPKVFFQKIEQKEYQIALNNWFADFRDPSNFLDVFKYRSNGTNNTGWEHPLYIALLDHSGQESDPTKRFQLLRSAEYLLMDEMPIMPLFFATFSYAKRPDLQGVYFSDLGYLDFKHAYIGERKVMAKINELIDSVD